MAINPKQCSLDFMAALKDLTDVGFLKKDEAEEILQSVKDKAQARFEQRIAKKTEFKQRVLSKEESGIEKAAAYTEARDEFIDQLEVEKNAAKRRQYHDLITHDEAYKQRDEFKNEALGYNAFVNGAETNIKMSRMSLAGNIFTRINDYGTDFTGRLIEKNVLEHFNNEHYDQDVGRELWGEDTGNDTAKVIAGVVTDMQTILRNALNKMGATIAEAENYIAKLTHRVDRMKSPTGKTISNVRLRAKLMKKLKDPELVHEEMQKIAFQRWKATIEPLTHEDTFKDIPQAKRDHFFKSFYEALTTGIRKQPNGSSGSPFLQISGNMAKKLSLARKWIPKDADSWIKYNKAYGHGSVHDAILNQIMDGARSVGIMEKAGTNPGDFLKRMERDSAEKSRGKYRAKHYLRSSRIGADGILGFRDHAGDSISYNIMRSVKMLQYSHLGMLGFTSIPDINMMASALRPYGVSYAKTSADLLSNLVKGLPKDEMRELAIRLRVYSEGDMGLFLSRFGNVDNPVGIFSKMMQWQGKYSGINRLDNVGKSRMGYFISNRVASFLDTPFDKLPKLFKRIPDIYGLGGDTWEMLRNNRSKLAKYGKDTFFTPDIVHDISDEDIKNTYFKGQKTVSNFKINRMRDKLQNRIVNMISDQTTYGKVFPNESDYALVRQGLAKGSLPNTVWESASMFFPFHIAALRRHLGRFLFQNNAKNLYQAFFDAEKRGDLYGMGKYMAGSVPYGYLSYAAGFLAAGKAPPDIEDPKTWEESLLRGGGMFIYGSYLANFFNYNQGFAKSLLGRPINTAIEALSIIPPLLEGKGTKVAKAGINFAQYNLPFANFIGERAVLNRMIFDKLHEAVDPAYKQKLLAKMREKNEHFLWMPS